MRWAVLAILGVLAAGSPAAPRAQEPAITPTTRIDAVHGRRLAFRIEPPEARAVRRGVTVRTDDGTEIEARLYLVTASAPVQRAGAGAWLGPLARWRAIPGEAVPREAPGGAWYAVADLPIEVFGQGLWVGNTRHEITWLPDPHRLALSAGEDAGAVWAPTAPPESLTSAPVREAVTRLSADPTGRWRARLMTDGLRPSGALAHADRAGPVRSFGALRAELEEEAEGGAGGDEALEAIAELIEARWQVALARLWLIDPALCETVRHTAAGVARFGEVWAPCWDPSPLVVDDLLEDLLSPFVNDETRALRARAWLATQPRAVVWVFDDAGRQAGLSGDLLPTLGVVSTPRAEAPVLVVVEGAGGAADASLEPVPPRELRLVGASVPPMPQPAGAAALSTGSVRVRVARWETGVGVLSAVVGVRPPGFQVGPLLEDWTLPSWRLGAAEGGLPVPSVRTVAMLTRRSRPTGGETRSGWTLLVECRGVRPDDAGDSVRIWLGPYGRPTAVLRVDSTGQVVDEVAAAAGLPGLGGRSVPITDVPGGWAFEITLPPDSVDDGGILRLGLDRTDAAGRHTGWPRRMLPWQREPGRLAFDTRAWDGLGP